MSVVLLGNPMANASGAPDSLVHVSCCVDHAVALCPQRLCWRRSRPIAGSDS